jgi:DNA-binding IclR family transcriptional regulator
VSDLPDPGPTKGAQSLHRAMQLLATVGEHNVTGIRLTELAQATGLHVATAHRLLSALVREQMVAFDVHYTKRYFLGLRLHSLVDLARYSTIRARLRERFLATIVVETGTVAYLYVPLLNDMIALDCVEYPRRRAASPSRSAGASRWASVPAASPCWPRCPSRARDA